MLPFVCRPERGSKEPGGVGKDGGVNHDRPPRPDAKVRSSGQAGSSVGDAHGTKPDERGQPTLHAPEGEGEGEDSIDLYALSCDDQCERNPECLRGFRHRGKGGHCSLRGTKPRVRLKPLIELASLAEAVVANAKQASEAAAPPRAAKTKTAHAAEPAAEPVKVEVEPNAAQDLRPGDAGFNWKGLVVDVPSEEFGQAAQTSYRGEVTKTSGMHVQIYFNEDNAAYWFKKKTVQSKVKHTHICRWGWGGGMRGDMVALCVCARVQVSIAVGWAGECSPRAEGCF